jgi:ABC-type transport system substrate-binding protein
VGRLWAGLLAALVLLASACTESNHSLTHSGAVPRYGGTLRIVGDSDVDHLDTASAYSGTTYTLERAFARQLVTYPASGIHSMPTALVPDLALNVPTPDNGGVTDRGLTYTYHLRKGPLWDTSPPRPVTAIDVVRGIKRLCNPAEPAGATGYYESTIAGMTAYCNAFQKVAPTVPTIDTFMANHDIPGVRAVGQSTVIFHLVRPAIDFNNIMALPFSSPAPVEYQTYVPGTHALAEHIVSDGPYRITAYEPGTRIVLQRNLTWKQSADPVRHAYVDRIEVAEGVNADSAQLQLQAGSADLPWDTQTPAGDLSRLMRAHDPRLMVYAVGALNPYGVINLQSPNANRATSRLDVRRALEYAVDRAALVQLSGGPTLSAPLDQVITAGNLGYRRFDLYPGTAHHGDPARARALLATAGYPHGLTLKLEYPNDERTRQVAEVLQADYARAGITITLVPAPIGDFYGADVVTPSLARAGKWDLALGSWGPDWFGNNGRTTIQPLLDGATYGLGSEDFGDYDSSVENRFISRALAAPTAATAAALWHRADVTAMKDAAIIPLVATQKTVFHSARVQHWRIDPGSWQGDVTAVWLSH